MSLFISFEGNEGAGKSTQIKLVAQYLTDLNLPFITVREPGGTRIGDRLRELLLDPEMSEMQMRTEVLLYAASRAQLVEQMIRPALASGQIVLCDRFVDSTIAYQGYGAGWPLDELAMINQLATGGLIPDRTYLLCVSTELGQARMNVRGVRKDRMEQKAVSFHQRVVDGYQKIAANEQQRIVSVAAHQSTTQVFAEIQQDIELLLVKNRYIHKKYPTHPKR